MKRWLVLSVSLVLAFVLRVWGANFGLPHLYAWDEPQVVTRAMRFASGDLNPHFFFYPALYMYILFLVNGLYFGVAYLIGVYHSAGEFAATLFMDPTNVYLVSRITTAVFGTACVYVTYRIGDKFFDRRVGLLASLFLSVSVLHVGYSHVAVTDVPQTFFIALGVFLLYNVATRGTTRDYILCGVATGLGGATKYLGSLAILSLLLAHFTARKSFSRNLILALLGFAASFFIASPFTFLDFHGVIADLRSQLSLASNWANLSPSGALSTIVTQGVPGDIGWPLFIMTIAGLLVLAYRHNRTDILLLSFPAVYLLFLTVFRQPWGRYLIPGTPFMCLMAGLALVKGWDWVSARTKKKNIALVGTVATLLIAVPLFRAVQWNMTMAYSEDTRTSALRWAEENIPSGTPVTLQPLSYHTVDNVPLLTDNRISRIEENLPTGPKFAKVRDLVMAELEKEPVYHLIDFNYDIDSLKRAGVRYVFMTDASFDRDRLLKEQQFKSALVSQATLIREFDSQAFSRSLVPEEIYFPVRPPKISVFEMK